jgi:hypothetical protein
MKHKFISFYQNDLPKEIPTFQKKVFDYFNCDLEQVEFTKGVKCHASSIEYYLQNNTDWDIISIFDVDCVPFKYSFLEKIFKNLTDDNTLYGNAQASNIFDFNLHKSPPFVAPSFINFSYKFWESCKYKSFGFTDYPNPDGKIVEADVAEAFSRECEKDGKKIVLAYPTHCYTDHTWQYDGSFGYPKFGYGNATEFESDTYHNFQIRVDDKQRHFVPYCKNIIKDI